MRYWLVGLVLAWPLTVEAGLLCTRTVDGSLFEYQSAGQPGACLANATASGVDPATLQEQVVTVAEWEAFKRTRAFDPVRADRKVAEQQAQREAEARVQAKLGLTDEELKDLREALR